MKSGTKNVKTIVPSQNCARLPQTPIVLHEHGRRPEGLDFVKRGALS